WLISTDGGTTNSVIPGATLATYDPGPITQTTWYRRCARRQGCTNYDGESNWVQVTLCPNPTVNAGTNQTITCSTTSASIGSSSVSGLTYAWSPATGLSSTSISNPVATPTTTTTYTLTVTNSCGCSSTASVTVTVNKTPPVAVAGSPATLTCSIPSAPIGASSVSGNVYSWSPSTGLSSTTISNPVASPTTTKTYTVTVTGSNGCTATSSVQVTVNKTPPTADAGPDQSVCTAQSASIGAAAIAGNSYSWSPSAGLSASTISNPIATPSSTTTYTVTVTGSNGCSATDAVLVTVNICVVNISGTVFNDLNALLNGNVDGTGLGNPDGTALNANLIASNGTVVNATLVNTNGSWQITNVPVNQNYTVVLSTTSGTSGSPSPVASLPVGWVNTGEDCCDNTGSDGVVNGITAVSVATSNVTQINFGIQQPPTPGTNIQPSQVNPGGNTSVPVPANAWSGTDPSGGIVTSLQITSFPSNANSITVNGTNYTSAGFPSGGISVPTSTNGQPTQPIQIDPVDGVVNVTIPYRVYDNANTPSPNTGYVQLPFTLLSISGNVYEDKNGSQNVDGTPIGQPSSQTVFAILTNASSTVLASVTVSAGGYFQFNNIPANSSFTVLISTVAGTVGAPAPSASLPIGWTHVAEDCCDQVGNDGNTNGATSVTVGMTAVTHVDFGIHQPLSIGNLVWLDVNRNGLKESSESGLAGTVMKLYADANTDGVPDGAALQTTLSDASGLYLFSGLDEGNYIVGATPPAGNVYTSSVIGQELNPNDNTDHNDNGITLSGSELLSGTLQIAANTEPVGELPNNAPLPDVNANLTLDFGFYVCPPAFTFPNPPVCPGNTVDLHAFEPQYFTGGTWMQGTSVLSNVLVGAGTYTYTFQEGTCSSGGPITVENNIPDYTPTLSIAPSAIQGTSTMRIILTVSEIENRTPCSDVYVFVPRLEPRFTMTYDSLATNVGGVSVQNANWQFFNTNPNFYVWKYIGSVAFPALSSSKIGFLGSYNPNQTDGETTFSVQVFQGSGGETNFTNNTDSEILLYFR
ncbi:MAG TPA: SdrD B-like domain-containing protein, partial [Chitinophagaceae bacterium]|nr:SdrD B-like domain-containing protein [Chitinophagaceae bacterium]